MPTVDGDTGDNVISAPGGGLVHVSSTQGGAGANSWADYGVVSPDGTLVIFISPATNLAAGDGNGRADLFIKNLATGEVTRVTGLAGADPNGTTSWEYGVFSADGTKFYYVSRATNLAADGNTAGLLYELDVQSGTLSVVRDSLGNATVGGEAYSFVGPATLAYSTGDEITLWDLATGDRKTVITGNDGDSLNSSIVDFSVSPDGSTIVFSTMASNLPGENPMEEPWTGRLNVFLVDVATNVVTRAPFDAGGNLHNDYEHPVFSADGRSIWYRTNDGVFRFDLSTGTSTALKNADGEELNADVWSFVLSPDGEWIAFTTDATNVLAGAPSGSNIYLKSLQTGEIIHVSAGEFEQLRFSADSSVITFDTPQAFASGDTNNRTDVYAIRFEQTYTVNGGGGNDQITGGSVADQLDGGSGDDVLTGGAGDDLLAGSSGSDAMAGGAGDDVYYVTDAGDTVAEAADEGTDLVNAARTYSLGANVENLTLMYGQAIDGTGNALANVITGNSGANVLSGLGGEDALYGGLGHDALYGGDDADSLYGGAGNDDLNGEAGADLLYGHAGADRLDGGAGADRMEGGDSGDTYVVDDAGDVVVEAWVSHVLADNVEGLTLMGAAAIDGTGNAGRNTLTGNGADNRLDGGAGDDLLSGGLGADTLVGGAGADRLSGGDGADLFRFSDDDVAASLVVDRILDLDFAGGDVIDLSAIDGAWAALSFVTRFSKQAGQVLVGYAGGVTTLNFDLDGDGKADYRLQIDGDHRASTGNLYTGPGDTDGGWVL